MFDWMEFILVPLERRVSIVADRVMCKLIDRQHKPPPSETTEIAL